MSTAAKAYREMRATADHCWACGRTVSYRDRPAWWFSDWYLQRAHLVNKTRVEDIRCVAILCPLCHGLLHGTRYAGAPDAVRLTLANLLWLKRTIDPENYDRKFLKAHSVQNLPRAARPPKYYAEQYQARTGRTWEASG